MERLNLENSINEIVEIEKFRAESKGNKIKVLINKEIPSFLLADQNRFQQVFLNVLNNANKFTKRGTIKVFCNFVQSVLLTMSNERCLEVRVVDSGIGISKQDA